MRKQGEERRRWDVQRGEWEVERGEVGFRRGGTYIKGDFTGDE